LRASVVVVDNDLLIRVWNGRSFQMWGLRSEEVEGRPLLTLDIGFPVEQLRQALIATLAGDDSSSAILASATSRRGQTIQCVAQVNRLTGAGGRIDGAIVLIEEVSGSTEDPMS
jgi:two-component system CheB/CheR fusion protein